MPIERVTPAFIHHPVFEEQSHDATLWRYMDFTRFVALLERRALFFSGITEFPDRFEASLTPSLKAQLEATGGQALSDWRNWPRLTFLNCWERGWTRKCRPLEHLFFCVRRRSNQVLAEPHHPSPFDPDDRGSVRPTSCTQDAFVTSIIRLRRSPRQCQLATAPQKTRVSVRARGLGPLAAETSPCRGGHRCRSGSGRSGSASSRGV